MLPLNLIETRFQNLGEQAVLDGRPYRGLPDHRIGAVELRRRLLDGTVPYPVRDQIWADLIGKTRTAEDTEAPALTLIGLAMPGLRRAVNRALFIGGGTARADLEAEVLAGFLQAVHVVDLGRSGICGRLCEVAHTAARALDRNAVRYRKVFDELAGSTNDLIDGHVDLVLAAAVGIGIIDRREADLIGATRLDRRRLTALAKHEGRTPFSIGLERRRAEARLIDWLKDREQGRRSQ